MAAPTVLTVDPANNEVGVYKNKVLQITFSEALLASTVSTQNFTLRNLDLSERVPVDVVLDTTGTIVSVTPTRHLMENAAYKLYIVGASTAVGTPIQDAATSTDMATTVAISFSSGTEIEVDYGEKTEEVIEREGQIDLPSNVFVVPETSYYKVIGTSPQNKEFGVADDLSEIVVAFGYEDPATGLDVAENLDTSSVTDLTFVVDMGPYYEEDDGMMAFPTTSDGACNFQWQAPTSSYRAFDFTDVPGTVTTAENSIIWTRDSDRTFPCNSKVRVTLKRGLKGVTGKELDYDYRLDFYIKTAPTTPSVERLRDNFRPFLLNSFDDALIGKTIYKNMIEALSCVRWQIRCNKPNRHFMQYVMYAAEVDIFEAIRLEEEFLAGQFKKLGDLVIRYDVRIPDAKPAKMRAAEKKAEELKDMLTARFSQIPLSVVKGGLHISQRRVARTRQWTQDLYYALEGYSPGSQTGWNTRDVRATRTPGQLNPW